MTHRSIDILTPADIPLVVQLYNQVYHPPRDAAFFAKRLEGHPHPLLLAAIVDNHPAGFFMGFANDPDTFLHCFYGVLPDFQGQGLGSQLMTAADEWAKEHGYANCRLECDNRHRRMLHLALAHDYDIAGIRWEPDRHANTVVLSKML